MATSKGTPAKKPATKSAAKKTPVKRKIVSASTGEEVTSSRSAAVSNEKKGQAKGLRIAAVVLWLLAILAEVAAILLLNKTIYVPPEGLTTWLIVALGVDLVLLIAGSQCWKKANHIDPASKANKFKFWLWNNLGLVVSIAAFLPVLILLLNNKKLDAKTKKLASIIAAVALALGLATSYDWNPVSQEEVEAAQTQAAALGNGYVFWTAFGQRYHLYEDCSSLNRSAMLYEGTVEEAVDAGRDTLCQFCAARADAGEAVVPSALDVLSEETLDEITGDIPEEEIIDEGIYDVPAEPEDELEPAA